MQRDAVTRLQPNGGGRGRPPCAHQHHPVAITHRDQRQRAGLIRQLLHVVADAIDKSHSHLRDRPQHNRGWPKAKAVIARAVAEISQFAKRIGQA